MLGGRSDTDLGFLEHPLTALSPLSPRRPSPEPVDAPPHPAALTRPCPGPPRGLHVSAGLWSCVEHRPRGSFQLLSYSEVQTLPAMSSQSHPGKGRRCVWVVGVSSLAVALLGVPAPVRC